MRPKAMLFLGLLMLAFCAFAQVELFPFQTFSSWTVPATPPTGWTRIVGGSEGTPAENTNDWHPNAGSGTWSTGPVARIYWSPAEIANDWLISPTFNPTVGTYDSIVFVYESDHNVFEFDPGTGDEVIVLSTNGGTSWPETLWYYGASNPVDIHETRRINITSLVAGFANCKIAFWAGRDLYAIDWWEVDNVVVYGYEAPSEPEAPLFTFTCTPTLPAGTTSYGLSVNIGDATGVNPASVQACYRINGGTESCISMTYVTGAPDGTGQYTATIMGLNDWDAVSYYFRATDTFTPPSTGTSTTCNMVVSGQYYLYEDGTGLPMSPNPTWRDISTIGWDTGLHGDDIRGWLVMPFTFRWYGVNYDTLWISTNGWISLGSDPAYTSWLYYPLPRAAEPMPMIAPWWDDFITSSSGTIYYYISADSDTLIFQYQAVPRWSGPTETFQIVFVDPTIESHPGGNGSVVVRYQTKNGTTGSLGISNNNGTAGIQYWYDNVIGSPDYLGFIPGRAIRYCSTPPPEGGELWGYVTLTGRTDHSGATVGIVGTSLSGVTDATGLYQFGHIPPGTHAAYCTHPAFFGDTIFGVIIVEGAMTRQDFTLFPRPTGYIAGYANLTDTPGADANIFCEGLGTPVNDLTDATGYFLLDGIDVGLNQVVATFPGYNIGWSPVVEVFPGETTYVDTIHLTRVPIIDLEAGDGGAIPDPLTGGWQWGTPSAVGPATTHSGTRCWGTLLNANYLNDANWKLDLAVPYPCLEFSWWQWIKMEDGTTTAFDGGNMKYSTDGGATWIIATPLDSAYNFPISTLNPFMSGEMAWSGNDGEYDRWLKQRISLTPDVTNIRFHFSSDASVVEPGWYVDDFSWLASPTGSLRVYVYDCNSYAVLEGAHVFAPGASGYTGPDGSVLLDNVQYGDITVTAGKPGYWPNHRDAVVFIDHTTTVLIPICPIDLATITGQLEHNADDSIIFELCNPTEDTIWFLWSGFPLGGAAYKADLNVTPDFSAKSVEDIYSPRNNDPITVDHSRIPRERPSEVGMVIDSFDVALVTDIPWGLGLWQRLDIRYFWLGNIDDGWGSAEDFRFNAITGAWSGIGYDFTGFAGSSWMGDMAWDDNNQLMWQVAVGGSNKLYGFDVQTGDVLDSLGNALWTGISQRGVGYDYARDLFYCGGWNSDIIYEIKGKSWDVPGQVIRQFNAPNCAGVGFDPSRRTIWYAANDPLDYIYEIDPASATVVNAIPTPNAGWAGGYALAGLEVDHDGRIWIVNMNTRKVYILQAPAAALPGGMFVDPTTGFIAPGECVTFALINPAYANPVGDYDFDLYFYPDRNLEPTQIPVHVQVLPKARKGWNLISVPVIANPADPFTQFRDDITPFNVDHTTSNIWGWNQDGGIFELPTGFTRGRGYYLKTWLEGTFWDVYGAPYAAGDFIYPVYYPTTSPSYGWWLIGNPYNKRVDWDAVYAATDFTYIHPEYWTWSEKDGYKFYSPVLGGHGEDNYIDSWRGYFINTRPGNPAVFTNIVYPQDGTLETFVAKFKPSYEKAKTTNPQEFALRVSVTAVNGSDRRVDTYNYLSVNELASDPVSEYDVVEPTLTMPGGTIRAFFENTGIRLARDTKQNFSLTSKSWTFVVRDLPAGMTVTLAWPRNRIPTSDDVSCGVENLDRRWNLTMTDLTTGATINMRESFSYTFTSTTSPRRFTMTLGDVPLDVVERKLPEEFALSANKPNPFNATTEFTVALPEKANVTVEVFDLLGQKVSTLVDGEMEAGFQRIIWNGRDINDREVPSGLYLYKVTAGTFQQTRKMTLIK